MAAPTIVAVVPAAGAARRFGSDKLLHDLGGAPLLERTLRALLDGGVPRVVLVAAPGRDLTSVPSVEDARVTTAINPDPDRGMFSSILVGLTQLGVDDTALILPADMPYVQPATVARLVSTDRASGCASVAVYRGRRGHPLILPERLWRGVIAHADTVSLKAALAAIGADLHDVETDDPGVVRDVDEPRDVT